MVDKVKEAGIKVYVFNVALPYGKFSPRSWFILSKTYRQEIHSLLLYDYFEKRPICKARPLQVVVKVPWRHNM